MPSADAQLSNIRAVYQEAGLDVKQTAYVECHGTGTPAGDPKEASAVSRAFCADRDADKPILIGSIKPNVGHLEGAAGIAGLIKAIVSVERGQITKNLYFDPSIGNPDIDFEKWKVKVSDEMTLILEWLDYVIRNETCLTDLFSPYLQVPTELTPWPIDGIRRASVNCFGFGGTNAHVILDEADTYLSQRSLAGNHWSVSTPEGVYTKKHEIFPSTQLFLISSHDKDGIARITEGHEPYITSHALTPNILADYAYTLSRRSALQYKTFIVAQSPYDLAVKLSKPQDLEIHRFIPDDAGSPKIAMVFCGQGAQWYAMGRELMEFEPFRNSIVSASKHLSKISDSGFDLLHELSHGDPAHSRIHEPEVAQPATTAIQVALVDLLKAANIHPHAVVGHSSGEIAAAYAAGFVTREDAWVIAFNRGRCTASLGYEYPDLKGRMMAVGLSAAEAQKYIARVRRGLAIIACENSPDSVTLSGDEEAVLELAKMMAADGIFHRLLAVKTAYHSHHMSLIDDDYYQSLEDIIPKNNNDGPLMFSSVTGESITGSSLDASYWSHNLVSPVLFNQAFSAMYKAIKPQLVIEISPNIVLNRPVREIIKAISPNKKEFTCIPLLKRDMNASVTVLEGLGEAWARGIPANFSWALRNHEGNLPQLLVNLPPYPFNHTKSYWFESHLGTNLRFRNHGREDLIGAPLAESTPQEPRWRGFFRLEENPWLADHQVQKATIYPAAGLLTMALEAARQSSDPLLSVDSYQISNFNIAKPVIIPAGQHGLEHTLSAKIIKVPSPDATRCSAVYSFSIITRTEHGQWQENADGLFTIFYCGKSTVETTEEVTQGEDHQAAYKQVQSECTQSINPRQLYERLDGIGMNYGPLFQNIVSLSKCQNACTSIVRIPDTKSKMPAQFEFDHLIHPATLDAMFQTVFSVGDTTMVPSYIRQITFSPQMLRGAGAQFHGYATAELKGFREARADIVMSDETFRKPMVVVKDMHFIKISSDASSFLPSDRHLCSEIIWQDLGPVPADINGAAIVNEGAPVILLLPDGDVSDDTTALIQHLALPNFEHVHMSQLSEQHMRKPCISLLEVDKAVLFNMASSTFEKVKSLLLSTPCLLWITTGAQKTVENPTMAPFIGLARTIRSEDSSKRITTLDLGTISNQNEVTVSASAIRAVFNWSSVQHNVGEVTEVEYSLREGRLYGARLNPLDGLNSVIEKGKDEAIHIESIPIEQIREPVELMVGHVTDISSTYFVRTEPDSQILGANDVRISVESTNIFPIDLETIMGKGTESVLGADVVGTVTELGKNVTGLAIGSLVIGLARSTIKTSIVLDQCFVHQIHDRSILYGLSPTALVTAYHGLNNVAGISSGDIVFVNHAVGPYGDATLRLSKALGATIFVGVLNTEEHNFIHKNYGIPMDCIINTANDRFPDEIMRLTNGSGVDFFFSPTPDHLDLSAQCVAENGHLFLTLVTNATASKAAVIPQHSNISFHKFDLFALTQKRAKVFSKVWAEVFQLLTSGKLGDCPADLVREERVENLDQLWQNMSTAPGRYINTVTFTNSSIIRIGNNPLEPARLDPKATYVLVGGLGGLGKAVAKLMVDRGARHLLFLSRSGAKTTEDFEFLQSLAKHGVITKSLAVDICQDGLEEALAGANMPPIKGAIQCAAVIADSVFETMTYSNWIAATRPKMMGSWNLHNTLPQDMDFFIFLSSASGIIGNRGQGNYAAGNCFQDALARHRAALGMKNSVSIDLGPVMGAGMLENDEKTLAILKASGFFMVMLENFNFLIERAMSGSRTENALQLPPQVITGVGTGGLILQNEVSDPFWTETKLFEILNRLDLPQLPSDHVSGSVTPLTTSFSSQSSGRSLVAALKHSDSVDDVVGHILQGCVEYLSVSLGISQEDMDTEKSLTAYGVDSLVTSSFRNWIFKNIGVKITDMEVIGAASIVELAHSIAEKGNWCT